jgi:dGTPase
MLARFACDPNYSKGRLYQEKPMKLKLSGFEVDRGRIIESNAFRRLEHKTQVFISHEGDHYRNRLTHSLEAAQIARIISNALNISSDLSETLTLAHDLGHAPFGHAGEEALNEVMQEYGEEFDHNSHTINLLTKLENKYPSFEGLNLTWEVIEGIAKHNGPLLNPSKIISNYSQRHNLLLNNFSSLESQVSSIADDIAYNNHDIDDGFREGLLTIEELREVSLLGKFIKQVEQDYSKIDDYRLIHEATLLMKEAMIIDVIASTKDNIKSSGIKTCEDIRFINQALVTFSDSMEEYHQSIKKILYNKVYKHHSINRATNKARRMLKDLFYLYMDDLTCLPGRWQTNISLLDKREAAIVVCDFIACMSDRYAVTEYRSFFELS